MAAMWRATLSTWPSVTGSARPLDEVLASNRAGPGERWLSEDESFDQYG